MFEKEMISWAKDLFPLCRSLTGEGTRKTLQYFEKINPELKRKRFKSRNKVFDWIIPDEWNITDAYIQHIKSRKKFAEFKKNNLHIVGYSVPINAIFTKEKLIKKIHSLKKQPSSIPYVTSYYKKEWGFCMSENEKKKLPKGKYKVVIKSILKEGFLELSDCILKGKSKKEIFFSSYVCHPSMANNELSGPVLLNALMKYIKKFYPKKKYTYRFVLLPETIGSIAYLSKFHKILKKNIIAGFNISCVGDEKKYTQIFSPSENSLADNALYSSLIGKKNVRNFSFEYKSSDERQYCSPLINLPLSAFYRSNDYKEYHTHKDDFKVVTSKGLGQSFQVMKDIIDALEEGMFPKNIFMCEPFMSKRKLYSSISRKDLYNNKSQKIRMNLIAFSDGKNNIFEISRKLNTPLSVILKEYKLLKKLKVLK